MAKKKSTITTVAEITIGNPIEEYAKLCGSNIKANRLKDKFSEEEIETYVKEIKSKYVLIDSDNPFDFDVIEQLAEIRVQIDRLLKLQRSLMVHAEGLENSDQPADVNLAVSSKLEAAKTTEKITELYGKYKQVLQSLNQSREQREKNNKESRINFSALIKLLDDQAYKDKVGKYGELLKKAMLKKQSIMIEDGLITIANDEKIVQKKESEVPT